MVIDDDRAADCSVGLTATVRFHAGEPWRVGCYVVDRSKVNIRAVVRI